jgi:hypothetical protein
VLAARLAAIGRVERVVHGHNHSAVGGRSSQFRFKPINLRLAQLSTFGAVTVQADDRD